MTLIDRLLPTLTLLVLFSSSTAPAQSDGDPDTRWNDEGWARDSVTRTQEFKPSAAGCASDGSVYAAAETCEANDCRFRLLRFDPGGSASSTRFADFDLGGVRESPFAIAVQADGRVVVVGSAQDDGQAFNLEEAAIARFVPNHPTLGFTLDPDFAGGGRVAVNFVGDAAARAVAIDPQGRIVVAGYYRTGTAAGYDFFVLRFLSTGAPDNGFDGNGIKTFGFDRGGTNDDGAFAVAVQPDGRIVVAGKAAFPGGIDDDFAIARLETDGDLDPTFSGDGRQTVAFDFNGVESDAAFAVALDRLGRIVVGGFAVDGDGFERTAMTRLAPGGTVDGGFAIAGKFVGTQFSGRVLGLATTGSPDRRVLYLTDKAQVGAFNDIGDFDSSFGAASFVTLEDPAADLVEPGGMALCGGEVNVAAASRSDFFGVDYDVVARLWIEQVFGDDFEIGSAAAWSGW